MVHIWSTAALFAAMGGSIVSSDPSFQPMSMQLHRLPSSPVRSDIYHRRRMVGMDANSNFESVPLNLGMGYVSYLCDDNVSYCFLSPELIMHGYMWVLHLNELQS